MAKSLPDPASVIEHTLLKPDSSKAAIENICREAIQAHFFGVCVPPFFVSHARRTLEGSPVKVITVAGFPFGYSLLPVKAEETRRAVSEGADEVDMVINIASVKSGNFNQVRDEIQSLYTLCHLHSRLLKVIIEAPLLNEEEIRRVCDICAGIKTDFVKTSTGVSGNFATVETVKLLRSLLPPDIRIKAAGGIRTRASAIEMLEAGADRIGTSAGLEIINSL